MTNPGLAQLLAKALAEGHKDAPVKPSADVEARALLDLWPMVTATCRFSPGTLVRQSKAFGETYSFGDAVCVVTHVFDEPLLYREAETTELRNDMIILVRHGSDQVPREFPVQSWRFERYTGPIA